VEHLRLLSLAQITALIGRGESTLRRDIREGRLKPTRLGRQVRVSERALQQFIAGHQKTASKGRTR